MVFDGDAVYFTSDNGLYKIDLPIIVAEWCWDSAKTVCYYDEDEGEAEDEDYMPLITYVGPADAGGTSGFVCGSLTFDEALPSYAPHARGRVGVRALRLYGKFPPGPGHEDGRRGLL